MLDRDRVALYTAPPLSGGIMKRTLDFQGPCRTLGVGRILVSIDIDFGELPDSRVYDPGAVTDFKELPPDSSVYDPGGVIDFKFPDTLVNALGADIDFKKLSPVIDFKKLSPVSSVYDPGADIYFAAGKLIIRFEEDITLEEVEAFVDKYHCHIENILELCSLNAVIGIPFELTTGEVIDAMLSDPDYSKFIEHIGRNRIVKIIFCFDPDKGF